ncbi:MAG: TlpA family protein disulfide reductase [Acidobacteria bacterium]|nr:TlpA family protein disulfide reductase [Acidobacteriota bacterium]
MMRPFTLLWLLVVTGMMVPGAQQKGDRSAFDSVQEVSQLLREADRADATEDEANAARAMAREAALRHAARLKAARTTSSDKFYLAYLYYLIKDEKNALAAFGEVVSDPGVSPEEKQRTRLYMIEILAGGGRLEEAVAEVGSIPDSVFNYREVLSSAHNLLSVAYTKAGNTAKALEHEEQALQNARKSGMIPLIWKTAWSVAQLYSALDRKAEAVTTLTIVRKDLERQANLATGEVLESLRRGVRHLDNAMAQIEMVGKPAPPIVSSKLVGEPTGSLAELKGKVIALEFWAAWCSDCRGLMPSLREWAGRFEKEGLKVLAVTRYYGFDGRELGKATKADEERLLLKVKQGRGLPYGAVIDETDRSFERYNVATIPTVVIIDRSGRLRYVFNWHENPALCETVIKRTLSEPETASK